MIVVGAPAVCPVLLRAAMGGRRIEHLGFVAAVHLLVRSVVARACPACKLDPNAQAQPPNAQPRKPEGPLAPEGRAVVHPDGDWQTVAAEEPRQDAPRGGIALLGQEPDLEQVTALGFAHGQGLLALGVLGAKPAFEIDGPYLVLPPGRGQSGMGHGGTAAGAARADTDQPQLAQPAGDGAHRGEPRMPMELAQTRADFARPPVWPRTAYLLHGALPTRQLLPRGTMRPARVIAQRSGPARPIARQPFVTRFATHAMVQAEARKGLVRTQRGQRKLLPLQNN